MRAEWIFFIFLVSSDVRLGWFQVVCGGQEIARGMRFWLDGGLLDQNAISDCVDRWQLEIGGSPWMMLSQSFTVFRPQRVMANSASQCSQSVGLELRKFL